MTDRTSITKAVSSSDAAVIMQGFVEALTQPDSEDRKAVLAFLLAKIPTSSGNLEQAAQIVNNVYDRFPAGSPGKEAAADA